MERVPATAYYAGREQELAAIFGRAVIVRDDGIEVGDDQFPVVDDVIVTLRPDRRPRRVSAHLGGVAARASGADFAPDIQDTFGEEWTHHGDVLAEHEAEFRRYFDLVDLEGLHDRTVADLGCGSGRWAHFVAPRCRTLVVVDFSDAILVARDNLRAHSNVIFVLGDVLDLPFATDAFDLAYCLGVLHHLPADALQACRRLAPLAPELLVYLYYALDNRPLHFRALFRVVDGARRQLARVSNRRTRDVLTWLITLGVYFPLARLGRVLPAALSRHIPLTDTYGHSTLKRMRQDVEDRFFTGIEQRFSRRQIAELADAFGEVVLSDDLPYWHFLCRR